MTFLIANLPAAGALLGRGHSPRRRNQCWPQRTKWFEARQTLQSTRKMNSIAVVASALLSILQLATGCGTPGLDHDDNSVVWKGTRAYAKRVASFDISPDRALKMVLAEMEKPHAFQLRGGGILGKAEFIVDRWYWFGAATKIEIYAEGYYVNGDTGQIEFRESDRTLRSNERRLPKDTWRSITALPRSDAARKPTAPGWFSDCSSRRQEAPSQSVFQGTLSSVTSSAAHDDVRSWTRI